MEDLDIVSPDGMSREGILTVEMSTKEALLTFCQGIQAASPVDNFVQPVPGDMPGYEDPVIMAGGTFIQGSSIELSVMGRCGSLYSVPAGRAV